MHLSEAFLCLCRWLAIDFIVCLGIHEENVCIAHIRIVDAGRAGLVGSKFRAWVCPEL